MRVLTLATLAMLGGCSYLTELAQQPPSNTQIYLGDGTVTVVDHRDLDRYTCARGPLECSFRGNSWQCTCMRF